MKNSLLVRLLLPLIIPTLFLGKSYAQLPSPKVFYSSGLKMASVDSNYSLNINGRFQSIFQAKAGPNLKDMGADFILRRARLSFQGTAFSPRFSYKLQLGFSGSDVSSGNSLVANNLILRDAMIVYQATSWLKIGFGQNKLPSNRQFQFSSSSFQLIERSITSNSFNLDRDKGIWFYLKNDIGKARLKTTLAISAGEGRINSDKNGKLAYTGRMELYPLGDFKNGGDYIEGDIEHEESPKLAIAGVYSFNDKAIRTQGQSGEYLNNNFHSDIQYFGGDLLFKYRGFSFEAESYSRKSNTGLIPSTTNPQQKNAVSEGTSLLLQTGYFISNQDEIAARFAMVNPDNKILEILQPQMEYVLGYNHFFNKHNLKIQTDVTYLVKGSSEEFIFRISAAIVF